jgi:hypothetical protein
MVWHRLTPEDGAGQAPRTGESDGYCVAELRGDEACRRSMPLVVLKGRVIGYARGWLKNLYQGETNSFAIYTDTC